MTGREEDIPLTALESLKSRLGWQWGGHTALITLTAGRPPWLQLEQSWSLGCWVGRDGGAWKRFVAMQVVQVLDSGCNLEVKSYKPMGGVGEDVAMRRKRRIRLVARLQPGWMVVPLAEVQEAQRKLIWRK